MTAGARPGLSYVVNALNAGGTERLVVEMGCAFAADYRVQVICLDEPGVWAGELRRRGVPVEVVWRQPGFDAGMPGRLARLFRRHGTDIVHAHQCTPWFYAALSRVLHPRPRLLLEEHGRFYPEQDAPLRVFVNRTVINRLTHRFVAVSADIGQRLVRYEGLDPQAIEVVYNGVTPATLVSTDERAALRRDLGFSPDDVVAGTVGRFDPIKNLPMLVRSLEDAGAAYPRLKGLLIGDGPEFPSIRAMIERGPMRERVRLTGYRGDARRIAQCLDLFVLPSFSEGTSMALLEAMAAGVPAIVTRVGGNPEIVVQDETGWVVSSDAGPELTAALGQAVDDPDERRTRAERGRRRFEEKFTMDQMMASYRQRYREMLGA